MEKTTEELTNEFLKSLDLLNYKKGGAVAARYEYQMSEVYREAGMTRNRCKFCGFAFTACICEND